MQNKKALSKSMIDIQSNMVSVENYKHFDVTRRKEGQREEGVG